MLVLVLVLVLLLVTTDPSPPPLTLLTCNRLSWYSSASFVPSTYASLVWFGMTGKSLNLAVAVIDVLLGTVTWQLLIVLSPDIVCIALFYSALKDLDNHHTQQQKRMKTDK